MKTFRYFSLLFLVFPSCKEEKKTAIGNEEKIISKPLETSTLSSGKLFRIENFPSKFISLRNVDVWLPDNYTKNKKYSKTFGKIGVFSPSFWFSKESFDFAETQSKLKSTKMYFLAGNAEGEEVIPDMEKMQSIMKNNGFNSKNSNSKIVQGGKHNKDLWRKNFGEAVLWLFKN